MSYKMKGYRISEIALSDDTNVPEIQKNDAVYIPAGTWISFITRKGYEDKQLGRGVIRRVHRIDTDGSNCIVVFHYQGGGRYQFWTLRTREVFRAYSV